MTNQDPSWGTPPPPSQPIPPQPIPPQPVPNPPPPAGYPVQTPKANGLAIAGMVLGILWIYWIGSILALVFGFIAKGQIEEARGWQTGRGMAIAAIVLGFVGMGFLALFIVLVVTDAATNDYSLGGLLNRI